MHYLKDLVLETQRALKAAPGAETPELEKALDAATEFLTAAKSFEYLGQIDVPGSVIKLRDIDTDLDDIFKTIAGKKTDVKVHGEIYIVVYEKPVEEESKAAA